jgi:GTP cyclohydrolase II
MHEAERGLFELRRGRPLLVTSPAARDPSRLLATVDGLTRSTLDQLRELAPGQLRLAITHHRAKAMGLPLQGTSPVSLMLNGDADPDRLVRLASTRDAAHVSRRDVSEASAPEAAGLSLARLGRLLPAIVGVAAHPDTSPALRTLLESGAVLAATTSAIEAMASTTRIELVHVSEGPVPLEDAEHARFVVFREVHGLLDHVAVMIGTPQTWPDPVPVRLHSACLTGDLFGSLRCDCGEQLRGSLSLFASRGGGVLVYLAQEGRGIGLGNKLRAYVLQEAGLDTIEADGTLGFGADERRYDAAIQILRHLQIGRVQLVTNNPDKVRALREAGIEVVDRQPLYGTLNRHNVRYVTSKVQAGHWLHAMLSGAGALLGK